MKNAIILHGMPGEDEYYDSKYPSASNAHWLPWLQKQLLIKDIAAYTPEVPFAFDPQYELWAKEFERVKINTETILVGHSCGGGFIIRWLNEHPEVRVGNVVLVAPWLGGGFKISPDFFNFEIDPDILNRVKRLTIFNSDNDYEAIQSSVKKLQDVLTDINYKEFTNCGHFTSKSMGTTEFPELLEEVLI